MKQSENIAELSKALIAAQAEFPPIPKTKEVIVKSEKGSYVFKYAPLEDTLKQLRPILGKFGLGITQGADGENIVTTVLHESGQWLSHTMPLPHKDNSQQYGAAFTYRRRYSLKAALGIETDDDDADQSFTDDKTRKGAKPTSDCMANVPKERHEFVHRFASTIVDCFNAGEEQEGFKAYQEIKSIEERVAVWSFLDAKIRRRLKEIGKEKGIGT